MAANYVLIEKISVGAAGASSVTFSGIPQTGYTDLVVKASVQANNSASSSYALQIAYNGNAANYSEIWVRGSGASATSSGGSGLAATYLGEIPSTFVTNTFGNAEVYIPNYTGSNNKSFSNDGVSEANATTAWATLTAGLWANTSAITSITLSSTVNLAPNSTFYLYGVAKLGTTPVIVPYATGGDTIMTDGTYWYHTFISSGTFTPAKAITCDYLVVAGGGGSAAGAGTSGGGGGGGVRCTVGATGGGGSLESALSLTSGTNYTVTIGGGGAGTSGATPGNNGNNSVFSTITSTGGGASGGPNPYQAGQAGGSGGGGGEQSGIYGTGGAGTANQGYAGGQGGGSPYRSGGGGGAGAVGSSANANGGNGIQTSINGTATYYGGGGGGGGVTGGTAGLGGGGTGSTAQVGQTAGTANTGGGAGGAYVQSGVNGGSGIVIVRYLV